MTVSDLRKYKDNLYTSLSRNLSEFEKNFLLISGGILAFSISFIKEIVKIDDAFCLPILYTSWGFIIISIGLMMFTFLKSSIASDELWAIVDNFILANKLYKDEKDLDDIQVDTIKNEINSVFYKIKKKLKTLRYLSVSSFIFGVLFLAIYVALNLTNENKTKSKVSLENLSKVDSIVIYHNSKSFLINLNYGKDSKICKSKTDNSDQTDTKTTTNTKTTAKARTDSAQTR